MGKKRNILSIAPLATTQHNTIDWVFSPCSLEVVIVGVVVDVVVDVLLFRKVS